jgi:hypothetical protein
MNERDQELLDKQLWGVSHSPQGNGGALALALVAAFLGGSFFGGILFAHKGKQTQIVSHDVPTMLSLLNSSEPTPR